MIEGVTAYTDVGFSADGQSLIGVTDHGAPRKRVVRIPLDERLAAGPESWETLVAERHDVISAIAVTAAGLVMITSEAAVDTVHLLDADGRTPARLDRHRDRRGGDDPRDGAEQDGGGPVPRRRLVLVTDPAAAARRRGRGDAVGRDGRGGAAHRRPDGQPDRVPVTRRDDDRLVPHPSRRRDARAGHADDPRRLRRVPDLERSRPGSHGSGPGARPAGSTRSPASEAGSSTARTGTRPARERTSRTSSTTSRPPAISSSARGSPAAIASRSTAARTAACSSGPRSRSAPISAGPRSAACRCWTWSASRSS